ncbi:MULTISPECIES: PHB depolymerase family esterase [unclassified Corynebacterium]|uniref:alpha/beta hydrolase family esterase n=1 Tax=unclassified Corynebacterium TaxID=2624378 RepID=UPI002166D669|nr:MULTISPECIES: alpha/beta hydrolase [unclassified Corynebacterium]MCS4490276.1 poly(3-hydroxyalkanoate) depolymerase [Corynebacterium sp. ES2775-CONJ]MCS4491913.1 poly(3-hydroxyalkanoate) depolymerase [Corynebacterium sp. ES2715-CONJ3]
MSIERAVFHTSTGQERQYLFNPAAQPSGDIFIFLHGSTQSAQVIRHFSGNQWDRLNDYGLHVIYPEGIGRHWNDGRKYFAERTRLLETDDAAFINELARSIAPNGRVFCGGFSNGGHMVFRLLHEYPGLISGALIIGATQPVAEEFLCSAHGYIPTPTLLMHGTDDPIIPFAGGDIQLVSRNNRGRVLGLEDTAHYYAVLNRENRLATRVTGLSGYQYLDYGSVVAYILEGVGHHIPTAQPVESTVLGPGTDRFEAVDAAIDFFGFQRA